MAKVNIDLSEKDSPCCTPQPCDPERKYYPSIYYHGKKSLDLPKEGTMTVRFHKRSESSSENDQGEVRYTCEIEIQEIIEVEGEGEAEPPYKSQTAGSESALDALMAAMAKKLDK